MQREELNRYLDGLLEVSRCGIIAQLGCRGKGAVKSAASSAGEIPAQQMHLAGESGVAFIAADHHATGNYGAQGLGVHLAARFGVERRFVDIPNPV